MSRKSFIITAMLINLTICITLCIVMFTGNNQNKNEEFTTTNMKIYTDETTTETETNRETEIVTNEVESQVVTGEAPTIYDSDGTPIGTVEEQSDNVEKESTTTAIEIPNFNISQETEATTNIPKTEQETTAMIIQNPVSSGTAVITGTGRIRRGKDTQSDPIKYASVGEVYNVDMSQSDSNWVAIILEDNSVAFIARQFCNVQ